MRIAQHIEYYRNNINNGLDAIDQKTFASIVSVLTNAFLARATIFVCGNGGSASISEHFTCDHGKGIATNTNYFPKFVSLNSNVATLTAYANDCGYENVFKNQLVNHAETGDVLIAISSSGNSKNIIEAIQAAKKLDLKTISFTGFDGGEAKMISDLNIHIPVNNYGVVEDCHQIIMHMLAQYIRVRDNTSVDLDKIKL